MNLTAKHLFLSIFIVALALSSWGTARAQTEQTEITLLAPMPLKEAFDKLLPQFEAGSSYKVKVTYAPTLATRQSVAKGEGMDVSLVVPPYQEARDSGNVQKSITVLASFVLAITVPKGAPLPDVSTPEAVKNALLAAKSIVAVDPAAGSAGAAAMACLDKLGIAAQVKPKMKLVPNPGGLMTALAAGGVDFALGPYVSDVRNNPKVDAVALPVSASTPTNIVALTSSKLKDGTAARALIEFLISSEAETEYSSLGMKYE